MGQGAWIAPPETFTKPEGSAGAGLSHKMTCRNGSQANARPRRHPQGRHPHPYPVSKAGENPCIFGTNGSCRQGTIPRSPCPSLAQIQASKSTRKGSDYGQARAAGRIRSKSERTR
ncbi:hypothetical protein BD293_4025 [Roseinatronobacter monicus]|uniref:Uncharacterized protein n=1 Tax=Roseinatronobacter monicus TaxID=393481 RepID=A0A543K4X8_9RHOB|nr:hypothetical protein BD293_4025 [Roseinatronobacter monicus]